MDGLLNMYAELQHYHTELFRSNESDIMLLMDIIEKLRENWLAAQVECDGLRRVNNSCEEDIGKLRCELKETKARLIEARSQIAKYKTTSDDLSRENAHLVHQIDLVRDLLRDDIDSLPEGSKKKLEFLKIRKDTKPKVNIDQSCSILANEIDYDKTEDSNIDEAYFRNVSTNRGGKRSISVSGIPSAPPLEIDQATPRKRSKGDVAPVPPTAPPVPALLEPNRTPSLNRSFSEPHLGPLYPNPHEDNQAPKNAAGAMTLSPALAAVSGRRHAFFSKSMIKKEICDVCDMRFGFGKSSLQCDVCKFRCHIECRDNVTTPCVGRGTPLTKSIQGKLASYVPRDPPMIPNVIVLCINEIEQRGLDSIGLYRVSGAEAQVCDLLDKFLNKRGTANLRLIDDVSVLTSCIKKFLQNLKEPLIPLSSWSEFVRAADRAQENFQEAFAMLNSAIVDLPQPNRDTLAFIIIHLQRVAERCHYNKMPASNLAKIFGPTIVGYSTVSISLQQATMESVKQEAVVKALLDMAPAYWTRFLVTSDSGPLIATASIATPEIRAGAGMLGPIRTGGYGTPGSSGYRARINQKRFFQQPWK